MAAPAGNQFWKLRSKHGRDRLFQTADLLWEAACEYFQWCDENPFHKAEAKIVNIGDYQSQVEIVKLPVMRPYTLQGLCSYLDCNVDYFSHFETTIRENKDENKAAEYEDFRRVLTRIREVIYNQKYSGAASGFFNANIIARDLGLADKKEVDKKVTKLNFKDAE
jgi:hypothetical protein